MAGRLAPEKNFSLALNAMREVIKKINALLVVVGEGTERQKLEREVLSGLEANVRFEGRQENLGEYYASADCFLLTSNYEGYARAATEAITSGLPVIMSDVGVAGEIVKDGENGLVVSVGDKNKFAEAIIKLAQDKALREKLVLGARNTKSPYSSFEEYRDKLINSWKTCSIR